MGIDCATLGCIHTFYFYRKACRYQFLFYMLHIYRKPETTLFLRNNCRVHPLLGWRGVFLACDHDCVWERCSKFSVLGWGSKWSFDVHLQMFNVGKGIEKKKYSANKLYHRDHNGLLILAIYVSCRLNLYIFFTFGSLFVTKSESCCDPYGSAVKEGERKKEAECGRSRWG